MLPLSMLLTANVNQFTYCTTLSIPLKQGKYALTININWMDSLVQIRKRTTGTQDTQPVSFYVFCVPMWLEISSRSRTFVEELLHTQ